MSRWYHHPIFRRLAAAVLMLDMALNAMANPTGMTVHGGSATATSSGSQLTVTTTSRNTFLNWQSFNIAAGETTTFQEPSTTSIVWNRINDQNPSQIFGSLQANGVVVLLNSSGFYFGPNSFVSAAGLVVSTANYIPPQNSGGSWEFNGPPPLKSIINYGQIKVGNGGTAFLIADKIENYGSIEAPGGSLGLAAGQTVLLSERPDGRGMSMQVTLPGGSVDNEGRLIADGGTIAMHAQVVNQNGFIQANSVQNVNGVIELVASDQLTLGASSQITASGDNSSAGSAGGNVALQSGNNFSDSVGSQITVTGGTQGGNGGSVEISAPNVLSLNSSMDASAQAGSTAGQLLLNSQDITLNASGANGMNGGTLDLNVNGTFANFSQIILQASGDITKGFGNITLAAANVWDLGAGSGLLTLEAGGDITFGNGSKIMDANQWSATLDAGYNFANNTVQSGVGNIYLNGGSGQSGIGSIQLSQAAINLTAGNSIVVGSGCQLIDDGGVIGLYAQTVNQNGLIQANSVGSQHGIIELVAFDLLTLGANSQITANGDNSPDGSAGGQIMLQTAQTFSDDPASQVQARGGANGGDGGKILIYAASAKSKLDVSAPNGSSGSIFYNPRTVGDLTLTADSLAPFSGFSRILFQATGDINLAAGETLNLSGDTGSRTSGLLTLEAGNNITFQYDNTFQNGSSISDANNWSVALYAGVSDFTQSTPTVKPGNGSISFFDEYDPNNPQPITKPSGYIQTAQGDVTLVAGQDITLGSAFVITTGGGSISAHALKGKIDTGNYAQGYSFLGQPNLNDGLGGISTEAGGDVTLIAGSDVTSVLPGKGDYYYDGNPVTPNNGDYTTAGSGAYGSQAGNVTIVAGGNVTGHYLVANGTGSIFAGGSAGTEQDQFHLALSLISGGWNVTAAQDIYLQEVRNPNGVFDINGGRFYTHYFNYAPGDYVNLNAGNLVQLGASPSVLPRPTGIPVPFIYPSILNITAGAGGVNLIGDSTDPFNQLILFPSPQGSLTINTTDGGSLVGGLKSSGGVPQIFYLIVSDSGSKQLTKSSSDATCTFGIGDHAVSPVHLDNSTPIVLNISGDMSLVLLDAPEAAQINVVGNMYNCRFQGMNLSANDVTSINVGQTAKDNMEKSGLLDPNTDSGIKVGGDIINRGAFTSVTLDLTQTGVQEPAMNYLSEAYGNSISAATLTTSLYYNKDTQVLTYQNISGMKIDDVLSLLQNLTVQVYKNGVPQWTDSSDTIPLTTTVSVLTPATAQALLAQYNAENAFSGLQAGSGPPDGTYGYILGGGGKFNITARTIDLGTTAGIQSQGVGLYEISGIYPLASLFGNGGVFDHGADINIITTGNHSAGQTAGDFVGDLDMYSSSIASLQGGDISIYAGGDVNAGSADFSVNTSSPRGIYSTGQGNVYVYADGDINVNGSRIAVYDTRQKNDNSSGTPGGSVTVVSRNGRINAGSGGSGFVEVSSYLVNPDQSVTAPSYTIPGSGIMEVSYTKNGNILVEAPNAPDVLNPDGTVVPAVNAAAGGILQLLLNGPPLPESTTLFGLPLKDLKKMLNLALNGKMKAALDLQTALNGNPGNCTVDVFAGYELQKLDGSGNPILDAYGDPVITALNLAEGTLVKTSDNQDIDATGSGVVGAGSVTIKATGKINGNFFASGNLNINAVQDIDVIALAGGKADLTGSSLDKSTVVAIGGIEATGDTGTATLLTNDPIGQGGLAPGTAADAASQGAASENSVSPAKNDDTTATDDDVKKKGKAVATVQKKGRVTVLLPPKHLSQNQTSNNHL